MRVWFLGLTRTDRGLFVGYRTTVPHKTSPSANNLSQDAFDSVLDAARSGAEWAWLRLVVDIDPVLRGYLARQGADDPDDLAGETWFHVARGLGRFDGGYDSFRSWVFVIGHHLIIDERRRRRRRPAESSDQETLDRHSDSSASAEAEAMDHIETDTVLEVLDQLTDDQREVVLLRVMGGFSVAEVAGIIGKKPGSGAGVAASSFQATEEESQKGAYGDESARR